MLIEHSRTEPMNEFAIAHETYASTAQHLGVTSATLAPDAPLPTLTSPSERHQTASRRIARRVLATDLLVCAATTFGLILILTLVGASTRGALIHGAIAFFGVPLILAAVGLYGRRRLSGSSISHAGPIAGALAATTAVWLIVAPFIESDARAQSIQTLATLPVLFAALVAFRSMAASRAIRANPERVLVVGAGGVGQSLARKMMQNSRGGTVVVGFADDQPLPLPDDLAHLRVWPASTSLGTALAATGATRLAIAFTGDTSQELLQFVRRSEFGPMPVSVVPRMFEITPNHARVSDLAGLPVVDLESAQLSIGQRIAKRLLDIVLCSAGLLVLAPIFIAVAVAIKLDSRGPIFFRQERMGRGGGTFGIYKFRTMIANAEDRRFELSDLNDMRDSGPLFKMKNDPRVTRLGRLLRRFNLDELPQLLNVLGGSMSLVGPRPFVVHEAEQIGDWGARRYDLTPGITGLWQISNRTELSYDEMIQLDYLYVTNWSIWWDIRLLLQTIPMVASGRAGN